MSDAHGPIVLLTGASSGIGRALAVMLVDRGVTVLGVTRRPAALPPGVVPVPADLTQREDILAVFQQLGRINALVNCAGVAYLSRIIDGNPADWEEMWRVNVMALTLCCQLSLRHFPREGGRIVNVSSMSGHRVPPTGGFYAPTKYFRGREEVLQKTRESMTMLAPEDVAAAILTILEAPTHVEIGDILLRSSDQRM
jgi:NADP-dependent 3-hydroxy acid dehydrogenase YdfG